MARALRNAGMQFGGRNYFLCWSGQRRSTEALWGRGLEASAKHGQVYVLNIVINTAVLYLNRFILDRQIQCTQHKWLCFGIPSISRALLWVVVYTIDIVFGCFCVFLWWLKKFNVPVPHIRSSANFLNRDFENRFRNGGRGWDSAVAQRSRSRKKKCDDQEEKKWRVRTKKKKEERIKRTQGVYV
jgi:hypothetical protein